MLQRDINPNLVFRIPLPFAKAGDQTKLALEISVIGSLMQLADDAI
jgi:hypothetical protein